MFGRLRLLLLMPHFCPSVSTFVQDLTPLSTAAWAAAAHAGRPEAVYQTGAAGCCCCWPQNLSRFEHSRAGVLLLVSSGHVPALFSPVAMLDSSGAESDVAMLGPMAMSPYPCLDLLSFIWRMPIHFAQRGVFHARAVGSSCS